MELYLNEGDLLVNFIRKKYGNFTVENLINFFQKDFYSNRLKLTKEDIEIILFEMERLVDYQGLSYSEIKYLGSGQSFAVLQVGAAVIKVGRRTEVEYADYRLSPVYEKYLKGSNRMLYVSPMANGREVTEDEMLDFYEMIKEKGSIWLDPKANNLGYVDHFLDFKGLYGVDLDSNYSGPYLIDYEDIITMTSDNRMDLLETWGTEDDKRYLMRESDPKTFYYLLFTRKRNNMLEIEKRIALRKGDFEKAYSYEVQQRKNFDFKTDYYSSDYSLNDRIQYPPSLNLIKQDRKYKTIRTIKQIKSLFPNKNTPKK